MDVRRLFFFWIENKYTISSHGPETVQQVRCFPFYCVRHVNRSDNALKAAAHVNTSKQQLHDRNTQSLYVGEATRGREVRPLLPLARSTLQKSAPCDVTKNGYYSKTSGNV